MFATVTPLSQMPTNYSRRYPSYAKKIAGRRIAAFVSRRRSTKYSRPRASVGRAASTRVHEYTRTCGTGGTVGISDSIIVNTQAATGLLIAGLAATAAYDMEFSFSLTGGVDLYIAGALYTNYAMPVTADFTNLYEKYRIDWIECNFTFSADNSSTASNNTHSMPRIFMVEDNDDTTAINLAAIQQYDNLKQWQLGLDGGVSKKWKIHPTPLEMVYLSAIATGYQKGSNKKWINTAYGQVPHYGMKMIVDPITYTAGSVPLGCIAMSFKYHFTFCDVK